MAVEPGAAVGELVAGNIEVAVGLLHREQELEAAAHGVAMAAVEVVVPRAEEGTVVAEAHPGMDLHPAGSPVMPEVSFISVTRAGVSKGSAIERIAAHYGVPMDRVMMVGDGENDVSAMRVVGHPVAMGNADPPAIAASRYRVAHVDDGGLREAVELALTL